MSNRKRSIKSKRVILSVLLLGALVLTACTEGGKNDNAKSFTFDTTATDVGNKDIANNDSGEVSPAVTEAKRSSQDKQNEAYKEILDTFIESHSLVVAGYDYTGEGLKEMIQMNPDSNTFAIVDIDNDGSKELIISIQSLPHAALRTYLVDYRDNIGVYCQGDFYGTPDFPIGFVMEYDSHSQGPAGAAVWPYTMYRHIDSTDSYEYAARVDGWDGDYVWEYGGMIFPAEYDIDGNKKIFYIMDDSNPGEARAVDDEEYQRWFQNQTDNQAIYKPDFKSIIKENVDWEFGSYDNSVDEPVTEPVVQNAGRYEAYKEILDNFLENHILTVGGIDYTTEADKEVIKANSEGNMFTAMGSEYCGSDGILIRVGMLASGDGKEFLIGYRDSIGAYVVGEFHLHPQYMKRVVIDPSYEKKVPSGRFTPVTMYEWYYETGTYLVTGSADAWDGNEYPTFNGMVFPKEYDLDGNGIIYYIKEGTIGEPRVADDAEYEAWYNTYFDLSSYIEPGYYKISRESVDQYYQWSTQ